MLHNGGISSAFYAFWSPCLCSHKRRQWFYWCFTLPGANSSSQHYNVLDITAKMLQCAFFLFYFTAINYVWVWLFKRHKISRVVQVKLITLSEISIHFWKVRVPTNRFRNLSLIKLVFWWLEDQFFSTGVFGGSTTSCKSLKSLIFADFEGVPFNVGTTKWLVGIKNKV